MKQRLQKLLLLGLTVATIAGTTLPVYAAEVTPNAQTFVETSVSEKNGHATIPATWDTDLVISVSDCDLSTVKQVTMYGNFKEGVGDYSMWVSGSYINAEAGTVTFPKSVLVEAIKSQNEALEREGIDRQLSEVTGYNVDWIMLEFQDGTFGGLDTTVPTIQCKNPLFTEEKPQPEPEKPQPEPEIPLTPLEPSTPVEPEKPDTEKPETVKKEALENAIKAAERQVALTTKYTKDSIAKVNAVLKEAKALLANEEATQADVDAMILKLEKSVNELVLVKPAQKPEENKKPSSEDKKPADKTAPKTGDVAGVAGLVGTSMGSLGVALVALKRRFRK